ALGLLGDLVLGVGVERDRAAQRQQAGLSSRHGRKRTRWRRPFRPPGSEPAVGHDEEANGRGGPPGQERATPPLCIERLLEGTLLTYPRSTRGAVLEPGDEGERPLRWKRDQVGTG